MANTFNEKVTKFIPVLDDVYKKESLTAFLDVPTSQLSFVGANKVKLPTILLDGAGDYDRVNGYVQGGVTVDYTEHTLAYDRGRRFDIDVIDDDEAGFDLFRTVSLEYVRRKEIPETDAIRFAEMYAKADAGSGTIVTADLDNTTALQAFDTAEEVLGDAEVPEDRRILFVSNKFYKDLKQSDLISRRVNAGDVNVNGINRRVELLDGMTPIIRVPKNRFYDQIQLNDGTTAGQEAGGYIPVPGGLTTHELNFIYADQMALKAITKRRVTKTVMADVNQAADANSVYYRQHHDLIVPENMTPGIYVHRKVATV